MSTCTYKGFTNCYAIGAFIADLTHSLNMLDYDRSIFDEAKKGNVFPDEILIKAESMANQLDLMSHIGENDFSKDLNELKQFLLSSVPI